jgi:glycosyltransferase involved in cell wall biosynthesis
MTPAPELTLVGAQGARLTRRWDAAVPGRVRDQARTDTIAWIKRLRHVPYTDRGRVETMRDRFTYRGDSWWWFTELYLQKMRRLDTALLTVRALDDVRAQDGPARLAIAGADAATAAAARAWSAARGVPVDLTGTASWGLPAERRQAAAVGGEALRARALRRRARPARARVAAFVHTAFWRGSDTYIAPVLDAVAGRLAPGDLHLVGLGPRHTFTQRAYGRGASPLPAALTPIEALSSWRDLTPALALWRRRDLLADQLVAAPALRDAARVDDVDLWPILEIDLRGAATVQWPWSARSMDEAAAALDQLEPETVVTYAEAGGWGRALTLEARRRGVRSVGLQHGFIYRHWLNYLHDADEFEANGEDHGCPIPDVTLLYDGFAEHTLQTLGHYPPERLCVTGSPRLDALAARLAAATDADRVAARRQAGVTRDDERLVLVAAKFSEIKDDLAPFLAAARTLPAVRVAIKAHPAEVPEVYAGLIGAATNVIVLGAEADLAGLLRAADLVVTKNSTVALDGIALGVPAMVIGLPNNLSPFVDAGAMVGAEPEAMTEVLQAVLYDRETRAQLRETAEAFCARYGIVPRGSAAGTSADAIIERDPS